MLRTASDISALTPEQLRELVASLQKDVASLERKVKTEHEKRCKAECDLWAQREAVKENLPALKAAMREFSREVGPYGDLLSMSVYEQVSFLCSELIRLARDAAMYRHEHYGMARTCRALKVLSGRLRQTMSAASSKALATPCRAWRGSFRH